MKICTQCKQEKELSEFNKNNAAEDGLRWQCKLCQKEYRLKNKDKMKKYHIKYYLENQDKIDKQHSKYYLENQDKIKEYRIKNKGNVKAYNKEYHFKNKDRIKKRQKEWQLKNKDKVKNRARRYYLKNKDRIKKIYLNNKEWHNEYRLKNKDRIKNRARRYYLKNKDKINKRNRERQKSDSLYKLRISLKGRIQQSFKRTEYSKTSRTHELLGADYQTVFNHLESAFWKGMTWENQGKWEKDHIIPLASAKTEKELIKLYHYTNLQPLWAKDNRSKSDKIPLVSQIF